MSSRIEEETEVEIEDVEIDEEERDAVQDTDADEDDAAEDTDDDESTDEASDDKSDASDNDDHEEGGEEEEEESAGDDTEEEDKLVVTIGDEEEPDDDKQPAPQWVKDLRKQNRAATKRIKELEKQLATATPEKQQKLGPKPTLESSGYDAKAYEKNLDSWFAQKSQFDRQQAEEQKVLQARKAERDAKYQKYNTAKAALKVSDFDDAEEVVIDHLSETQQGILVQGSADPALLVYALGKNEAQARKLAKIEDTVEFIFAVAKLEAQLKVTNRKPKTKPEKKISKGGKGNSAIDSQLNRLRAEAEKTGDYTKVIAYKKKYRSAD